VNPAVSTGGRRGLWAFFAVLVVFLYAPIVILIIFSFNDREIVSFPWQGFTFRWYQEFLSNGTILSALKTSAVVALFTAVLTTALAIPAAIVLVRRRFFAKGFVSGVMLSPLVIPLVVFGISLLVLFNTIGFPLGLFSITIGHIVIALPFAILTLVPRLERIPSSLEEASRDLGASGLTTFRLVTLPLMVPALISAALISYTISFDEVVVASFIAGDTTTFPLYLYSQLRLPENLPQVIAVAVVVMAVSVVVVVASEVGRAIADRRLEHQTGVSADELETSLSAGKG
jgi:spermidine/putrescine transport system permease protein